MMDLQLARTYLRDRLPAKMGFTDEALNRALVRGFNKVWRAKPWKFTQTKGQFRTYAVYDTGTVTTLAALGTAVTFAGTSLDNTYIGRHLRIGDDARDYEITAVGSATTCTIKDPYEGTAIAAGTEAYEISAKVYRLPCDVHHVIAWNDTVSNTWLSVISRRSFEQRGLVGNAVGQAEMVVEAGYATSALTSTGTVALVAGSTSVTGTSTAFDARMIGQALVVRGFPFRFKIQSVESATALTLETAWPFDAQPLAKFEISPAGTPMVELYPIHDENKSIQIWYHRRPPEIVFGDTVAEFDGAFDDLWIDAVLNCMGLMDEQTFDKRIGDLADADGIDRSNVYQLGSYGDGAVGGGPRLTAHSPPFSWD